MTHTIKILKVPSRDIFQEMGAVDGVSIYLELLHLPSGIKVRAEGVSESRCRWDVEDLLAKKLVEYYEADIVEFII